VDYNLKIEERIYVLIELNAPAITDMKTINNKTLALFYSGVGRGEKNQAYHFSHLRR
jgi:hypothetical protein